MITTHTLIDTTDLRRLDGRVVISIDPQDALNLGAMLRAVAAFGLPNAGSTGSAPQTFDDVGRALMDARPFSHAYSQPEETPEHIGGSEPAGGWRHFASWLARQADEHADTCGVGCTRHLGDRFPAGFEYSLVTGITDERPPRP